MERHQSIVTEDFQTFFAPLCWVDYILYVIMTPINALNPLQRLVGCQGISWMSVVVRGHHYFEHSLGLVFGSITVDGSPWFRLGITECFLNEIFWVFLMCWTEFFCWRLFCKQTWHMLHLHMCCCPSLKDSKHECPALVYCTLF